MDISIIIPVYNEEENISLFYKETKDAFSNCQKKTELIFINDGSGDNSLNILKNIMYKDSSVKVISFDKNYGKTSALDAGFKNAEGEIVLTIDCDLQDDPKDLIRILKEFENDDINAVFGRRINDPPGFIKNVSSRIATTVRNMVLEENYRGCYLAGYKKRCIKNLILYRGFQDFIPPLLRWEGYNMKQINVKKHPRRYGKSKYGIRNRLFKGLFALFAVKWMKINKLRYKIVEDKK